MYKLSIIVPIYGVEKYLCKCLDSIYSQADERCQVILVDDASPDRCGEICEEYKARYPEHTIVIHQENMGLGGARNSGMAVASGEYYLFVDSDDYISEGAVKAVFDATQKYDADVLIFPFRLVDEDYRDLGVCRDNLPVNTLLHTKDNRMIITGYPNAWNKVARASLYRDNDISFPSRVWYEDIRTTPKMLSKADTVVYLEHPLYNYLQREGSIMNNAKVERNVEIIEALDDLLSWFQNAGLYAEFCHELDYLIIDHVFVSATVRVLRSAGAGHHLIGELRDFTYGRCTTLSHNKYLSAMPKNRKLIFKLLSAKLYFAVQLIFKIKG